MSAQHGSVDLYWIPLGAGARFVRLNGIAYEAAMAAVQRRRRRSLYHSVLALDLPHGRYLVEMTPQPDAAAVERGVVAEGPVGLRVLGHLRLFRYEVRRWRDGIVPDLSHAVSSPVRLSDDAQLAQRVFDALPLVPRLVWGRDELGARDMWSCNSITSWALTIAGIDVDAIPAPPNARAPGWEAGRLAAQASDRYESMPSP